MTLVFVHFFKNTVVFLSTGFCLCEGIFLVKNEPFQSDDWIAVCYSFTF